MNKFDMRLMNTPEAINLDITSKCNLRCSYCYYFSSEGDTGHDLPFEEWTDFFKECRENAVMELILCGGEPLIRKDFKQLVQSIVDNKMRFAILTNGTLITDDIASFIKSTKRCNYVQVSLDGPGPKSHDICRGKGSFHKALEGLKLLLKHKINATVRVTIHKHNIYQLDKIAELLLEKLNLPSFSTNSASYLGLCRQNNADIQLNVQDYSFAMQKLLELNLKYNDRIGATAGPLADAKHWLSIEKAVKNNIKNLPNCGYLKSCGGVFSKLAVRSDGTIIPCSQINHIDLGRINKEKLKDIWQNHPELESLRKRRNISLANFEYCKDCKYIPYCRGGCPALAYNLTGYNNIPSPDTCYKKFLEMGGKVPYI